MTQRVRLGDVSELGDGQARGFAEQRLFVVRYAGRLHAWRDLCPHYGDTPLAWKRDAYFNADGTRLVCSAHGAQFEPDTGLCTLGPCLGQSLTPVAVWAAEDGALEIEPFQETSTP